MEWMFSHQKYITYNCIFAVRRHNNIVLIPRNVQPYQCLPCVWVPNPNPGTEFGLSDRSCRVGDSMVIAFFLVSGNIFKTFIKWPHSSSYTTMCSNTVMSYLRWHAQSYFHKFVYPTVAVHHDVCPSALFSRAGAVSQSALRFEKLCCFYLWDMN